MDSKIESIFATANDDNIPKKLTKELLLKYFDHPILESNTHHIITKELQK